MGLNLGSLFGSAASGAAGGASAGPIGAIAGGVSQTLANVTGGIGAKSRAEVANADKQSKVVDAITTAQKSKAEVLRWVIIGVVGFVLIVGLFLGIYLLRKRKG